MAICPGRLVGEGLKSLPLVAVLVGIGALYAWAFTSPGRIERSSAETLAGARAIDKELEAIRKDVEDAKIRVATLAGAITETDAVASHYADFFNGRKTADGTIFFQDRRIVAHKELPFGTPVFIVRGDRLTFGTIRDRGPFIPGRDFDLSRGMAAEIGLCGPGTGKVRVFILRRGK